MTRRTKLLVLSSAVVGLAAVAIALVVAHEPALPAATGPTASPPAQVARGAVLASLGDCAVCHTAEGGSPFAGGRPLATPFGILYATNITPDRDTGIGDWSPEAFRRAMRQGVSRDGRHLYPALPYDHFALVSDADLDALYAFLTSLPPVRAPAPANALIFPLGFRPLLAGWKLLFLHPRPITPVAGQSADWNRGRYLVEGLGHCGGCHSPRNPAGAEETSRALSGGSAEGWSAPALGGRGAPPKPWTADTLFAYLRTGFAAGHGAAGGPMGPVTQDLAQVPESDVRAIAIYIASLSGGPPAGASPAPPVDRREAAAAAHPAGAMLFAGACAGCHENGAPMARQGRPTLAVVTALQLNDPGNAVRAVLDGIGLPADRRGAYMPAFAASLNDRQIAEIIAYLRARFSERPAWSGLDHAVAAARKEGTPR